MTNVSKLYSDIIQDVIVSMKEDFISESLDTQVLVQLQKLWMAKLADTHAVDPTDSFTQNTQVTGTGNRVQVRTVAPSGNREYGGAAITQPKNVTENHFVNQQPLMSIPRLDPQMVNTAPINAGLRMPMFRPSLPTYTATNIGQSQQHFISAAALTNNGMAPQYATLPSGITGQLVQIGQQTYLVPQSMINIARPQLNPMAPLGPSQIITNTGSVNIMDAGNTAGHTNHQHQHFNRNQVDGGNDSDDSDSRFSESLALKRTPNSLKKEQSVSHRPVNMSNTPHKMGGGNSDTDDDDFVPATPRLTPRPTGRQFLTPNDSIDSPRTPSSAWKQVNDLSNRGSLCERHPPPAHSSATCNTGNTPIRQLNDGKMFRSKQPQSPTCPADEDADETGQVESPFCGEDAEIMTTTTMTPVHRRTEEAGFDDDEEGDADDDDESFIGVGTPATPFSGKMPSSKRTRASPGAHGLYSASPLALVSPASAMLKSKATSSGKRRRRGNETEDRVIRDDEEEEANELGDDEQVVATPATQKVEEEEEEEPLNSGDDVSEEEPEKLFDSDNVVVCQYDKIHRSRNRWRLHLKDGIMALNGRDFVFQKATGEAEW